MRAPTDSPLSRRPGDAAAGSDPYAPELGSVPQNNLSEADLENVNKTGTTTVGMTTADGVVLATDMRASLGGRFISNKDVQKVEQIHPTAAITMAGSVGGAQSFIRSLRAESNLFETRRGKEMTINALATLAGNFLRGGPFFLVSPILGGVDEQGHHVYSLDPAGGVMTDKYTCTGSGMQMAYGVLEQEYDEDISNEEALGIGARAVQSAVERDTASGDGVYLAEVTDEGVDIHGHKDFDEVV